MPDSTFRTIIDGISFLLLLIISIYIPFVIAYDVETKGTFEYFEVLIDIWFILEIILNFITGYYEKGVLIMDLPMIAKNYLKGYLLLDILSSFPISFITMNDDAERSFSPSAL